jgi:hypothetical protein
MGRCCMAQASAPILDATKARKAQSEQISSALAPIASDARTSLIGSYVPNSDITHSIDFRVFFATSIKARSLGAKEARRG